VIQIKALRSALIGKLLEPTPGTLLEGVTFLVKTRDFWWAGGAILGIERGGFCLILLS